MMAVAVPYSNGGGSLKFLDLLSQPGFQINFGFRECSKAIVGIDRESRVSQRGERHGALGKLRYPPRFK